MSTKRQRRAAAKTASVARKRNILLAEGWSSAEIVERRLAFRSFEAKRVKSLRTQRKLLIADAESKVFINVADPVERREVAVEYAGTYQFDPEKRFQRLRDQKLTIDGFTQGEIQANQQRITKIPFSNPALKIIRRRRKRQILAAITAALPRSQRGQAQAIFDQQGRLFREARERVSRRDRRLLADLEKDYPGRLLDLYKLGA